jgi:hypothetical protein
MVYFAIKAIKTMDVSKKMCMFACRNNKNKNKIRK